MTLLLQLIAGGLASGFVIGLLALSLVMIYRSTRVLSFAQGAIASLTTYVYFQLQSVWGLAIVPALILSLAASVLIGVTCERAAMRPLRSADTLTRTVATLGIVLVLQMIMRVVWGGDESFVAPLSSAQFRAGSFVVGGQQIVTAVLALLAAGAFAAWTRSSYGGLSLGAIAQNRDAARLLGVGAERASMNAWGIGAALAGLAGILATPTLVLNPLQMTLIMVTALGAALVGRFESLPLALIGGLVIGVVESVASGYITASGVSEALGFLSVFVILLLVRGKPGAVVLPGRGSAA